MPRRPSDAVLQPARSALGEGVDAVLGIARPSNGSSASPPALQKAFVSASLLAGGDQEPTAPIRRKPLAFRARALGARNETVVGVSEAQDEDTLPATSPRTVLLAAGAFLFLIGLPAALFLYAGRIEVALGLLAIFALMVLATAYALKKAMQAGNHGES